MSRWLRYFHAGRCQGEVAAPTRLPTGRLAFCFWLKRFGLGALLWALALLAACGGGSSPSSSSQQPLAAGQQVLVFPNVGTKDISTLDPAQGPDANSALAVSMLYSGLVRTTADLSVVPDQATWQVSPDQRVYTFHLKPGITFSDGTPITAQTYVFTLTRQLLPEVKSPIASFFEGFIVGAAEVAAGKSRTLSGVRALDNQTLQITLTQPTPFFLEVLTNPLFDPLNAVLVQKYGQANWTSQAAGNAVGTGPFMVKSWQHNVKMVLVPNPHYYGPKPRLREVDMLFVSDPATAFKAYEARQYSFIWNIPPDELGRARQMPGFVQRSLLQTDLLFFYTHKPPFDKTAVRQAFAYAIDKKTLAHAIFKDAVLPANTIIPPGMPGYQANYAGLPYDRAEARRLLQSVYPDIRTMPPVVFTYPSSQVSQSEAAALQQMWQSALGLQVRLQGMDLTTYNDELSKHLVQMGFIQWTADFPDPYDWLTLNLTSGSPNNNGEWSNPQFDRLVAQAEKESGEARLRTYNEAERVAIEDVGWLPLDHQALAAVIPPWLHGLTLNGLGLYFGDWSAVYLLQH
ncbi:peptide ABC transporter substrate-binding protein [Thermogemmatispora carboxidivorans]|uniref:peptide ABC transporter substrate-binding protein n=1 Tax=Thermogemmatispora carboxidivorans TaxID=1382306 RepID=UPI00069C42F0|nr:peptide ABC transporter substrate-binding protein [Thermogemmatispora carboxidivorans]